MTMASYSSHIDPLPIFSGPSITSTRSCDEALMEDRKRPLDCPSSDLVLPDVHSSSCFALSPDIVSDSEGSMIELPMAKKRKSDIEKRAQMKYEPPSELAMVMSKEEIAAWRREQRRQRNRESAAASRQRQKDRIVELEAEVATWKSKYDEVMKKLSQLEESVGCQLPIADIRQSSATPPPISVPSMDVYSAAPVSPTQVDALLDLDDEDDDALLPIKMISRPAATRIYHQQVHVLCVPPLTA